MVKKLLPFLSVFFGLLLLNGCCLISSSCDCDPLDPELNQKTLDWINVYEDEEYFVFNDSLGNIDTFFIESLSDREEDGDDECTTNFLRETITLSSSSNPDLSIVTIATLVNIIRILPEPEASIQSIFFDAVTEDFSINENYSVELIRNYTWDNQQSDALKMLQISTSSELLFQEIIISKDFGLIEFVTQDNIRMIRID